MGKYYYLIAGLPDIALDDGKFIYSVDSFRAELEDSMTSADKKLVDLFFLKYENRNALYFLTKPDHNLDLRGRITQDDFELLFKVLKNEEKISENKGIPPYIRAFFELYLEYERNEQQPSFSWEDRLAAFYYEYAMKCSNSFVSGWFELNLNINNILTAITCRKYGLDKAEYIVGDNMVARTLRTSNARDFGLADEVEYLQALLSIAEETDLMVRERKIDLLKWEWLEEQTFFKPFDIESVYSYLLKLEMIERWVVLDKTAGENTFREIVRAMKKGSGNALDEFKRNNEK